MTVSPDAPRTAESAAPPGAADNPGHHVVGPVPAGWDADDYDRARRRALWSLPTGLYVIGSHALVDNEAQWNLMTASFVVQVATEPKVLAVSIDRASRTRQLVSAAGVFALSLLGRDDRALVRRFVKPVREVAMGGSGRPATLEGESVSFATTGAPVLSRALAWLDCEVRHQIDLQSHVLFLGEVVDVGGRGVSAAGRTVGEVLRMEDTRMSYGG